MKTDEISKAHHYNTGSIEVIEMMERVFGKEKLAIFCEINAFKYRMRAGSKPNSPIETDIKKAQYYEDYIKKLKSVNTSNTDHTGNGTVDWSENIY